MMKLHAIAKFPIGCKSNQAMPGISSQKPIGRLAILETAKPAAISARGFALPWVGV
jgi:hypothetical protein